MILMLGICPRCFSHGAVIGLFPYGNKIIPFVVNFLVDDGELRLQVALPSEGVAINL